MDVIEEEPTHREFDKGLSTLQKTPFEEAVLFEAETSEVTELIIYPPTHFRSQHHHPFQYH